MSVDTIRMIGTYAIAAMVLGGCFVLLVFPSQVTGDQLLPFITGIIGMVLGWVFNRESTTGGQRNAERAVSLGANTAQPQPTITTTAGPPQTTTVTPSVVVDTGGDD